MGTAGRHLLCLDTVQWRVLPSPWCRSTLTTHMPRNADSRRTCCLQARLFLQEHVDLVAGDFFGAAWRRQSGSDVRPISIIEEAFANTNLPLPLGSTPLWGPGGVPGEWSDVCRFSKKKKKRRVPKMKWQVRMHGAFTILFGMLGLEETDQSCHQETWIHLNAAG